jgi:hypothetical protein
MIKASAKSRPGFCCRHLFAARDQICFSSLIPFSIPLPTLLPFQAHRIGGCRLCSPALVSATRCSFFTAASSSCGAAVDLLSGTWFCLVSLTRWPGFLFSLSQIKSVCSWFARFRLHREARPARSQVFLPPPVFHVAVARAQASFSIERQVHHSDWICLHRF